MLFYIRPRTLLLLLFVCALLLLQILFHHPVRADPLPPENLRTATFYANHPAFMRKMLAACRDDPGHGNVRADCTNAHAGEMLAAEIDAQHHIGGVLHSPATVEYWKLHATFLPSRLLWCSREPAATQALMFCEPARRANQEIQAASTQMTQR